MTSVGSIQLNAVHFANSQDGSSKGIGSTRPTRPSSGPDGSRGGPVNRPTRPSSGPDGSIKT